LMSSTMSLILGSLLLVATAIATPTAASGHSKEHSIPTLSLSELSNLSRFKHAGDNDRNEDFRNALSTNGLLAINLDVGFEEDEIDDNMFTYPNDRRVALDGLCSCIDHPDFLTLDQTHELTLLGSSTARTSVATATVGLDHPLPLPKGMDETCGRDVVEAMEDLRDVVASVSRAFVSALDRTIVKGSDDQSGHRSSTTTLLRDEFGKSYHTVDEIVKAANHLEHFHVYTNQNEVDATAESESNDVAWDWHTDAGLFLVFVPAWDCNASGEDDNNVDNSFYYRDTDGTTVRAKFDGGRTAVIMLGQGAQDWLDLPQQQNQKIPSLKATTHSVRWSEPSMTQNFPKQRRAWYGMMNLVPETALVYGGKSLREIKQSLALSNQHKNDYQPPSESTLSSSMALGCGSVAASPHEESDGSVFELENVEATNRRQRRLQMQDASQCNNVTNFFCWMTCVDIPKRDQAELFLEAGYSLYCVDRSVKASTDSMSDAYDACIGRHNMECTGVWEKNVEGVPSVEIDISVSPSDVEIPFCYSGTTMYMEGFQFIQSSTCVIMLFPSWVLNTPWKYVIAVIATTLLAIGLEKFIQQRRKAMALMGCGTSRLIVSAAFYGVQLTIGYVLMLIIMIYSGVLFIAVILGLVTGHILFNARDAIWPIHESAHLSVDGTDEPDKNSEAEDIGIETNLQSSLCCANLLSKTEPEEERAIREGSTHCQEFDRTDNDPEYYGSMEFRSKDEMSQQPGNKKQDAKRKTIDQGVPEGSTPCCQHGA